MLQSGRPSWLQSNGSNRSCLAIPVNLEANLAADFHVLQLTLIVALHEVLGEAAVAVQPGEGSLDDLAAGQEDEAFGLVGPLDDLDSPFADPAQRLPELVSGIAAIGKDMA